MQALDALTMTLKSTFTAISRVPIVRDAALVEAGGDLRVAPQAKIGVAYTGQLANGTHHSVERSFTWRF
jgi:uncharacterized protein with beta-barrel porin domain